MTALAKTERAVYNQSNTSFRSGLPMSADVKKEEKPFLLSTKLKMPRPRRDYIIRRTLFQKLKLCNEMSIIFIKGAAGMGKTTLLSSFLVETGLKNTAWLSLDESNNNLFSFWHYFFAAAGSLLNEKIDFGLQPSPMFELHEVKSNLVFLINRLCSSTDYYIILDDFHCITNPALVDSFEFFLRAMPENLHLFLLSREEPPVYLGALAVSGRLLYLSGEDMKLSRNESMEFLRKTMKLKSDDTQLEKISSFAEGWVGGLQLAAASGELSSDLLKQGGGFVAEYLTREIFEKLSPTEQTFLVRTGSLSWFDQKICSVLFGALNFDSMMENLLDKNLFVICIDEEKGIYRYHNILGEYLRQQFSALPEQEQKEILCKAAESFAQEGDFSEAARLFLQAKNYDGATQNILEMPINTEAGEYISQIPIDTVAKSIDLAARGMFYYVDIGNIEKFDQLCKSAIEAWKDTPFCKILQYAYNLLSKRGPSVLPHIFSLSDFKEYGMRKETAAFIQLGVANLMIMDRQYKAAREFAENAEKICFDSLEFRYYIYALKAQLNEETGHLNDALEDYQRIKGIQESEVSLFMQEYDYHIGITGVYLKRMELDKAFENLEAARAMVTSSAMPSNMILYSFDYNLAEYHMLRGETEEGAKLILRIIKSSNVIHWADRLMAELNLSGYMQPELKEQILAEFETYPNKSISPSLSFELLCARLYLQSGNREKAKAIIKSVLSFSRENGNSLRLVEADLLLLHMTDSSTPAGRRQQNNLLREAIYYAWENRIFQPFYVDRDAVNPLWDNFNAELSDKISEPERIFVRDAIRVCSSDTPKAEKSLLSSRETEVLIELAQGKTNQQIAEDLCISLSTVKTHLISVYGKLGVSSRLAATSEGKRLGLIS